jgi:hypothetical protein
MDQPAPVQDRNSGELNPRNPRPTVSFDLTGSAGMGLDATSSYQTSQREPTWSASPVSESAPGAVQPGSPGAGCMPRRTCTRALLSGRRQRDIPSVMRTRAHVPGVGPQRLGLVHTSRPPDCRSCNGPLDQVYAVYADDDPHSGPRADRSNSLGAGSVRDGLRDRQAPAPPAALPPTRHPGAPSSGRQAGRLLSNLRG